MRVVAEKRMSFEKLAGKKLVDFSSLSAVRQDQILAEGWRAIKSGNTISAEESYANFRKKYLRV